METHQGGVPLDRLAPLGPDLVALRSRSTTWYLWRSRRFAAARYIPTGALYSSFEELVPPAQVYDDEEACEIRLANHALTYRFKYLMDPLSITVSALTLVTVCIKTSAVLHDAIEGFGSSRTDVQQLKTDVGDLNIVLQALQKHIHETSEDFDVLKLILQQCADACEEFHTAVLKAFDNPGARLEGVKAWVRLRYHNHDIEGFRRLIGSYKATLTIALADSNLRNTQATRELLETYVELTKATSSNLRDQIDELGAKLDLLHLKQQHSSNDFDGNAETQQTLGQKSSLEQCLSICQQLLVHIEKIRPVVYASVENDAVPGDAGKHAEQVTMLGSRITANAIEICAQHLSAAEIHVRELHEGSQSRNRSEEARFMQQLQSAQQCLDIVKGAQQHRVNVFEKIDTGEDSHQIVVSTIGDLIKANGFTIGARAVNIMGQMNDESLQKIVDRMPSPLINKPCSPHTNVAFEQRHGSGKTVQQGRRL